MSQRIDGIPSGVEFARRYLDIQEYTYPCIELDDKSVMSQS